MLQTRFLSTGQRDNILSRRRCMNFSARTLKTMTKMSTTATTATKTSLTNNNPRSNLTSGLYNTHISLYNNSSRCGNLSLHTPTRQEQTSQKHSIMSKRYYIQAPRAPVNSKPLFNDKNLEKGRDHFSFSKHNIPITDPSPHPLPAPDYDATKILHSNTKLDMRGTKPNGNNHVRLLSEELRAQNFKPDDVLDDFQTIIRTQSAPKNGYTQQSPPPNIPLFLDATQPYLTAVTPINLKSHLKMLSFLFLASCGIGIYSLYDIWINEQIYLKSINTLFEYVEKNNLSNIFSEGDTIEKLSHPYRPILNTAAASNDDFLEMQLLLNRHLSIGMVLHDAAKQSKRAYEQYKSKVSAQIAQLDPNSPVLEYYSNSNVLEESKVIQIIRQIHQRVDHPFFLAIIDAIQSLEPPPPPKQTKTILQILGLEDSTADPKKTSLIPNPSQNQLNTNELDTKNSSNKNEPILTPELFHLYNHLQEIEQYITMLDATISALDNDNHDLFEQFVVPTYVVQSTKQPPEVLQSVALSYSSLNSARLILQLLNFWLLYQQTKVVFPSLISFEALYTLWCETQPFDQGVIGRLVEEEQEIQLNAFKDREQLLTSMQSNNDLNTLSINNKDNNNTKLNDWASELDTHHFSDDDDDDDDDYFDEEDDDEFDRVEDLLRRGEKYLPQNELMSNGSTDESDLLSKQLSQLLPETQILDDDNDHVLNADQTTMNKNTSNMNPNSASELHKMFDKMIRIPGTIFAQEPPRYRLPNFIHPQHIVNYVTQIFTTPSFIPKQLNNKNTSDNNNGGDGDDGGDDEHTSKFDDVTPSVLGGDHDPRSDEEYQRDEIIQKFAAAPTLKAKVFALSLQQDELELLFLPPSPTDIIDLSKFSVESLLTPPTASINAINFNHDTTSGSIYNDPNHEKDQLFSFTNALALLSNNNNESNDLAHAVLLGFINELKNKGLPMNEAVIQTELFDVLPLLRTNFYNQISPIARLNSKSPYDLTKLSKLYSIQQQYLEQIDQMKYAMAKNTTKWEEKQRKRGIKKEKIPNTQEQKWQDEPTIMQTSSTNTIPVAFPPAQSTVPMSTANLPFKMADQITLPKPSNRQIHPFKLHQDKLAKMPSSILFLNENISQIEKINSQHLLVSPEADNTNDIDNSKHTILPSLSLTESSYLNTSIYDDDDDVEDGDQLDYTDKSLFDSNHNYKDLSGLGLPIEKINPAMRDHLNAKLFNGPIGQHPGAPLFDLDVYLNDLETELSQNRLKREEEIRSRDKRVMQKQKKRQDRMKKREQRQEQQQHQQGLENDENIDSSTNIDKTKHKKKSKKKKKKSQTEIINNDNDAVESSKTDE